MSDTLTLALARAHIEQGHMEEAHQLLVQVCIDHPDDPQAWNLLSAACGQLRLFDDAAAAAHRTVALLPAFRDGYVNLGLALKASGKIALGIETLGYAVQMFLDDAEIRMLYAATLEGAGHKLEAIEQLLSVCAAHPRNSTLQCNAGDMLLRIGAFEQAAAAYQTAAIADEKSVRACCGLGTVYRVLGRNSDAASMYRNALRIQPGLPEARAGLAGALERLGEFDAALEALEPLPESTAANLQLLIVFARISRRYGREQEAIRHLTRALAQTGTPENTVMDARFALGELLESRGAYEDAFKSFQFANQLKSATFDPIAHHTGVERVLDAYSADFMRNAPHATSDSALPIFIVGMPRSGTSLAEQILASHPAVHGAGELQGMPLLVTEIERLMGPSVPYPECIPLIGREVLDNLATRYLNFLRSLNPTATRVTDKLPGNWWNLGLIELLFPGSRIVHVIRDPRDSGLSCYFQNFTVGHDYSFDLAHIGNFCRDYATAMKHWQSVLRIPVYNIRYEDLVTNFEDQSRRLIEFCGLDWDPRCALPHKTGRAVNTASYDQVRRPVYSSSVGRWKNYERHIRPLMETLECATEPNVVEILYVRQ
jgi:tetratricopeptide (TPR) repeat protein